MSISSVKATKILNHLFIALVIDSNYSFLFFFKFSLPGCQLLAMVIFFLYECHKWLSQVQTAINKFYIEVLIVVDECK